MILLREYMGTIDASIYCTRGGATVKYECVCVCV